MPGMLVGEEHAVYVDGNTAYTNLSKSFFVLQATYGHILELEVLTAYEDIAASAAVLINNEQVGTIEPRPFSRYQDLQPYCIIFVAFTALNVPVPFTGPVNITIKPVSQPDWLLVAKWRVHYATAADLGG